MTPSRRRAGRGRDEGLGLLISCIGGAAILASVSPRLLLSAYGVVLGGGALIGMLLAIVFHVRQGGSFAGALARVALVAAIGVGSMYGLWWYGMVYLASQPALFSLQAPAPVSQPAPLSPPVNRQPASPMPHSAQLITPTLPVPSPTTCGTAVVHTVDALVLRAAPSRSAPQLLAVARGAMVDLLCDAPVTADDRVWHKVRSGQAEGYMSSRYLTIQRR